MSNKRVGVIRGLYPRLVQAELAASFSQLRPILITGEASEEIKQFCQAKGLEHRDLPVKPRWGIDPVSWVLGRRSQQSWVGPQGLLDACRDLDVLETYELYHFFSGQAAEAARQLNIPLVCEVWTSFPQHPAYSIPPYCLTVKKVIKQASLVIARSHRAAGALAKLGVPQDKIKVIYHGTNLHKFTPAKSKVGKGIQVLYVGHLKPSKGVGMLLDAWPEVRKRYPQARLVLVGDGKLLGRAKKITGVSALGRLPHQELGQIYRESHLFVAPSQLQKLGPILWNEEFFSYTLMEAQAAGLPIVATNIGGIPEEIGEENWLIPQGNPEALREAMIEALGDLKKLQQLGDGNRKRAEKLFDLTKQTTLLEQEILKLL